MTAAGSYYFGIFLATSAYVHTGFRKAGQDLIKDSYAVIASLIVFDLIVYVATAISPDMNYHYEQVYTMCEKAISVGNTLQIIGISIVIASALGVITNAIMRLGWIALLLIMQILTNAAKTAQVAADCWAPLSYIAGIITMINFGVATYTRFIFDNWLLLVSLGAFIRILPLDLGRRAGPGLVAFALLNYLLLPFLPTFRNLATFFLQQNYPFGAYFPVSYILLDGIFPILYIGFILWIMGGIARISFPFGTLMPSLGASEIMRWTRSIIQKGMQAAQQVTKLAAEQVQTIQDAKTTMNQRIEGARAQINALPPGNEGIKQSLLARLDELREQVNSASPSDILQHGDEMKRMVDVEVGRVLKAVDTIFYARTDQIGEKDVRELMEAELAADAIVLDALTPHKVVGTAGPMDGIQVMAPEGLEEHGLEAIEAINALPLSEDATLMSIRGVTMSTAKAKAILHLGGSGMIGGTSTASPLLGADVVIYRQPTKTDVRHVVHHEIGHVVYKDVPEGTRQQWKQLHRTYGGEIASMTQYPLAAGYPHESFAGSYAAYHGGRAIPDDVRFFFDQSHTWTRGQYKRGWDRI